MSFTLTPYILIFIWLHRLLWRWSIKIFWLISIIKTSPVVGQLYATAAETVQQFIVMIPFEGSYPTTFTGRLKSCTISACWPITHLFVWLSRSVCCSLSYFRTSLTHMVLTTEATDHSWRIICLVNVRFLLLVLGVAVPGVSGADIVIATSVDTFFTSSSVGYIYLNRFPRTYPPAGKILLNI